jgi:hypothetical protein
MRTRVFQLLAGLILVGGPAFAQQHDSPPGDKDIVVTGEAEADVDRAEVTRQARSVSRDTDVRHTALARFEDYACPGVVGLKRDFAEVIVARLRFIAEDLDIPLANETKCRPNIMVVFTEDGREDLAAIEEKTHYVTEVLSVSEQREILEEPGPVRVWSIVETRLRNGMRVPRRRTLSDPPVAQMEGGQSLISNATREDIVGVMVLFDRNQVRGKTLRQLADYAAMRVFARTRNTEGEAAPDSILGLYDANNPAPALALTEFDRAFLAALYEGVPYVDGIHKLQRVGRQLEKLRENGD